MNWASELGVEVLRNPGTGLVMEDGKLAAVMAKDKNGEEIRINCKAVIVATGGAGDNPQVIKDETGFEYGANMFNFTIPRA